MLDTFDLSSSDLIYGEAIESITRMMEDQTISKSDVLYNLLTLRDDLDSVIEDFKKQYPNAEEDDMSHFTVIVPATDEDDLQKRLLPYYEYGCSREFDELVKPYLEFDVLHAKEDFEKDAREILCNVGANNLDKYQGYLDKGDYDSFFEDWDGGCKNENGDWGRWHNPNAKWDWYQIGGRWTGTFLLKEKGSGGIARSGDPGLGTGRNTDGERCDWASAGEIDFERMKQELVASRLKDGEEGATSNTALSFAFIDMQDQWHEKAEMGWWGITSNPEDNYTKEFWEFIDSLDPNQILYAVDCHI